jgi:hypothetical protein
MQSSIESIDSSRADLRGPLHRLASDILRGREELLTRIFAGEDLIPTTLRLLGMNAVLLATYGLIMGIPGTGPQFLSSALKLPLLYLLSLAVCFPVLFVVNILMGSRLGFVQTLALILTALGLNAILLGACAPITLFFIMTDAGYDFLKLLHVAILSVGGFGAMIALYRALVAMCEHSSVYPRHALRILLAWILVFGFVGTQMAWTLRPFLGAPDKDFEIVRREEGAGNFYQAIWQSLERL